MAAPEAFFGIEKQCADSKARAGTISTAHGTIETPVFMPVGTGGSVKAVSHRDLKETGAQIMLGNTYHLYLRPGCELIEKAGGLHKFINWDLPLLTDSGGFQVWSLSHKRRISDEGVKFQSHIDGREIMFTPESVMQAQRQLGADIIMAFDDCPPYPCSREDMEASVKRTLGWTQQAREWIGRNPELYGYPQHFFGIVQGGLYQDIREQMIHDLAAMDFPGYAIGGLCVGEPISDIYDITDFCTGTLPENKPRYAMGMGTPKDLLNMIARGVDMFDCVIPTRNARNGMVWTWEGVYHYKAGRYAGELDSPMDPNCQCYACRNFSRAYLRHLFHASELTILQLASIHNLHFFQDLMKTAREKIIAGGFGEWSKGLLEKWKKDGKEETE